MTKLARKPASAPTAAVDPADLLLRRVREVAGARGMRVETLGQVGPYPLQLVSGEQHGRGPAILVAAGFHGDEPAGCWGLLRFLETARPELLGRVELSLLPLVNPTGLRAGRRHNDWGEDPNQGFPRDAGRRPQPSREGAILLSHVERLGALAADGFLSLHEDFEQERYYVYLLEHAATPGPMARALAEAGRRFFPLVPDGPLEGGEARGGVLYNLFDSTFDCALFDRGIPLLACTETPVLADLEQRIAANAYLIETFCRTLLDAGPPAPDTR